MKFEGTNYCTEWSSDVKGGILGLCNENSLLLMNLDCIPQSCYQNNQISLEEAAASHKENKNQPLEWVFLSAESKTEQYKQGVRIEIKFNSPVKFVSFHEKGDYFATVCPNAAQQNDIVFVHSLSKGSSQRPFNKTKPGIQKVCFHPNKPFLFVLGQKNTYIYNLQKQVL